VVDPAEDPSYLRQVELIQVRMMTVVCRSYLRQAELIQVRMTDDSCVS